MKKYDGVMMVTDLDGTIAHDIDLCGDNVKNLRMFLENGGIFTVATGRHPRYIKNLEGLSVNCPVISHNGALVWDYNEEKALYKRVLDKSIANVVDFVIKGGYAARVDMNALSRSHICTHYSQLPEDTEFFKAVICCDNPEITDKLRGELYQRFSDRYCIFKSWDTGVEVLPFDTNKGTAVKWLKNYLGDKVKKLICVGDHENDSYMLKCADIGYAVENASPEAKLASDRITVNYREGVIGYILSDLDNSL